MTFIQRIQRIENILSDHLFICSFLIVTLLFTVDLIVFVPAFTVNDDVGMNWIASGTALSHEPNEHLVYMNVIIGLLFKKLYSVAPIFPWYGAFHLLVHFVSMVFLLYAVLYENASATRLGFFLLFFLGLELYLVNNLQFTITSFIVGQAGIFLFLASLKDTSLKSWGLLLVAVLLLLVCAFIRIHSLYLLAILAVPMFVTTLANSWRSRDILVRCLLLVIVTSSLVLSVAGYHSTYYRKSPGWDYFDKLCGFQLRTISYGHVVYNNDTKYIFDELDWSENDFQMARHWFLVPENVFNIADLDRISSRFPWHPYYLTLRGFFGSCKRAVSGMLLETPAVLFIGVLFFLYVDKSKKSTVIKIYGTMFVCCTLTVVLFAAMKFPPPRVYYPMVSFSTVVCLFFSEGEIQISARSVPYIKTVLLSVVAMGLLVNICRLHTTSNVNRHASMRLKNSIANLNPKKEQLFVIWTDAFPHNLVLPLGDMEFLKNFNVIQIGWTLGTPFNQAMMDQYFIDDLYRALFDKRNVFLMVRRGDLMSMYRRFVKEHYGEDILYLPYYEDETISVFEVCKKKETIHGELLAPAGND